MVRKQQQVSYRRVGIMKRLSDAKPQPPKGELCEEKMAPWRKQLDRRIIRMMAEQEPLQAGLIKEHYTHCNRVFADRVAMYEAEHGRLDDPKPGEYLIAKKKCTDARQFTESLDMFLHIPMIHENTAGSIVREGHVFRVLHPDGFGIVEGHYGCGAMQAAHQVHNDTFKGDRNEHLERIVHSIPPAVAAPADSSVRDRRNSIHQAAMAKFAMEDAGMKQPVYSTFVTWEYGVDYQWLRGMPVSRMPTIIENEARQMYDYALAEGRNFSPQYATMTLIYDPYRLGRFNDPRITMDALMNEFFCVTFDFRRLENGDRRPLSRTGMGSLVYANFHNGKGHVHGVGGENGTHIVGVLDRDENVISRAIAELLSDPQIRELTRNGAAILPIRYDPQSRLVAFL